MTERSAQTGRRILVIDDNPAIHQDVRKILGPVPESVVRLAESENALFGVAPHSETAASTRATPVFQVDSASQGEEGVLMVRRACATGQPYALAFVDARMPPGWDGVETIAKLWEEDPDVLVVLCTAYSDHSWAEIRSRLVHPERLLVLKKPFDTIEILQLAEGLTEKWRLAQRDRQRLRRLETLLRERKEDAVAKKAIDTQLEEDGPPVTGVATAARREALLAALHKAIDREQLSLRYQPLVDIATRCVVGVETLLRWEHPELGAVSPVEFIPLAEQTGLIVPIGEFVLRRACRQIVQWERAAVPVVPVAVNVSGVQLERQDIWDCVRRVLREEGARPHQLVLEITESTLMENAARHARALQGLRNDGVCIEIDDFGTGYSSLSSLKHLPIDTIKIDSSFVKNLAQDRTDEAIVAAILAMTHNLGLRAVAEGVETAEQLEVLGRHGCEYVQGFYFCKPITAEECAQLLIDLANRTSFTDTLRLRKQDVVRSGPLSVPESNGG